MIAFLLALKSQPPTAAGDYHGWLVDDGELSPDVQQYIHLDLALEADGSFRRRSHGSRSKRLLGVTMHAW